MDLFEIFKTFLESVANSPIEYSFVLFVYAVLTAVILPFPVEIGLLFAPSLGIIEKSVIVALGKAIGALLIFFLGLKVEKTIRLWSEHVRFAAWFVKQMERFVAKTQYLGLYVLLSTPIMPDTISIYLFSLFNRDEVMKPGYFIMVNFLAAINRCMIWFFLAKSFGFQIL